MNRYEGGITDTSVLDEYVSQLFGSTRFRHFGVEAHKVRDLLIRRLPLSFDDAVYLTFLSWCPTEESKLAFWGEKHILPNLEQINAYSRIFPYVKIIHILRDGRAVCSSSIAAHKKRGKNLSGDVFALAQRWRRASRLSDLCRKSVGYSNVLEVRFEALISRTQTTLEKVSEFLGVQYCDRMATNSDGRTTEIHHLLDRPPQGDRIDAWTTELSPEEARIFDYLARDELRQAGYDPLPPALRRSFPLPAFEALLYRCRVTMGSRLGRI